MEAGRESGPPQKEKRRTNPSLRKVRFLFVPGEEGNSAVNKGMKNTHGGKGALDFRRAFIVLEWEKKKKCIEARKKKGGKTDFVDPGGGGRRTPPFPKGEP